MKTENIANRIVSNWESKEIDDIANDPKLLENLHNQFKYFKGVSDFLRNLEKQVCDRKYGQRTESRLKGDNKDTGTVVFEEENIQIKAIVKKVVTWEQSLLWDALNRIEKQFGKDVAKSISETTIKIPENKYKDADPRIQIILGDSRTVGAKGPDYSISKKEDKPHD